MRWRCGVCGGSSAVPAPGFTYVARRQEWIKVGMTTQLVERRLWQLRGSTPTVLAPTGMDWSAPLTLIVAAPVNVEHDLHEQLRDTHDRGEWFREPSDEPVITMLAGLVDLVEHWWGAA